MKYELEPDNRNCPDEVLLDDLRAVARRLGKSSLTRGDYNRHGRFSSATMQKRFGSWNRALERSGLAVQKRISIPHEELVADLKRVANLLGTKSVSKSCYLTDGKFSAETIARAFGSWPRALAAAGLEPPIGWNPEVTDDELMSTMAVVWEKLGRQPKRDDFRPPLSKFSSSRLLKKSG